MATPITEEQRKKYAEDHEKATLIKEGLTIVDKLAKMDIDDIVVTNKDVNDTTDELEDLIDKAKKLTKHRLWKLK
jgi:hypothetical protein